MAQVVRFRAAVALAGRFPALAGVDLSLDSGEVVLVVGANGAGKTSLLRACAGLLPVTVGEATVLGIDLTEDHTTVRRHVGLLGHAAPLYDELSAAENVRFAVRALRLPAVAGDRALERLGMVGRLRTTPTGRLSAGQRRRVALAALVARRPALWLLDEPHAGLDTPTRTLLGELINEAVADGAAVLLSSHEPELAIPLSDRVVVMSGGRITATTEGGRHRPLGVVPTVELGTVPAVESPPEEGSMGRGMWREAFLVAGKDLRIEARSRVGLWQVVPFAVLVLILVAFAIGPDTASLRNAAPGIFWIAVLFSTVLTIQRSVAIESGEGTRDGLRLSGIDPAGIFLGKAAAVGLQLLVLQVVLWAGVTFLFNVRVHVVWLVVAASLLATVGLACAGVLYGALSAGLRVRRDTLLPILVLPVLAPVLLAGSKAWQAALDANVSSGTEWLRILIPFAVIYLVIGVVLYGPLQEAA